jgi:cytochrome c-type biogenesis protein CcmH
MEGAAHVQWLPALVFLGVGLLIGAALAWRARKGKPAPKPAATLDVRDLAGQRAALVRQLRELEDTAAKRNPEQLARERYDLELALARTLKALDDEAEAMPAGERPKVRGGGKDAPAPSASVAPALRGFLWGIGSTAAIGLLLYFVSQSARPREGNAPVTGNTPPTAQAEQAAPDTQAEEREAEAAVKANPNDIEARLRLTRAYLARQDMMAVFRETQEILAKSPGNPQAMSYQALVRLAMGQGDVALDMLKKALKAAPDNLETYIHLSLVYARLGRAKESDATMEEASQRFPEQAPMLKDVQRQIRQAVQEVAAGDTGGKENPHAAVAEPGAGAGPASMADAPPAAAQGASAGSDDRRVSGTVELDPSLAGQVPPGAVIFVFVRDSGFGAGPPIAAKRLPAGSFPVPFEISSADSLRGDPIPAEILLEARADSDGDPMTHPPEDPVARIDDLKLPATKVRLVLKRKGQ